MPAEPTRTPLTRTIKSLSPIVLCCPNSKRLSGLPTGALPGTAGHTDPAVLRAAKEIWDEAMQLIAKEGLLSDEDFDAPVLGLTRAVACCVP